MQLNEEEVLFSDTSLSLSMALVLADVRPAGLLSGSLGCSAFQSSVEGMLFQRLESEGSFILSTMNLFETQVCTHTV